MSHIYKLQKKSVKLSDYVYSALKELFGEKIIVENQNIKELKAVIATLKAFDDDEYKEDINALKILIQDLENGLTMAVGFYGSE